jgi:MFS-type transporter involved in bile tolerance (Atg22 family)
MSDDPPCKTDTHILGFRFSKERLAWYLIDGGSSVYGLLAMLMFVPVYLLSLAEHEAWGGALLPVCEDQMTQCKECVLNIGWRQRNADGSHTSLAERPVNFFGMSVNAGIVPPAVVTISTVLQAILYVTVGGFADRGRGRKVGLLTASVIGQASILAFLLPIGPTSYHLAAILAIVLQRLPATPSRC